jgi:cell division protein FtsI (penicillin-binding protein 3)
VHTGEVLSMASLPDFDPNARPRPLTEGDQADSPLFNRAVQGVYELGSVFKTFTIAQALELNLFSPYDMIDTTGPVRMAGFAIRDFRSYGPEQTVADVLIHSSNIGTARIARVIGAARQEHFLAQLNLLEPTEIELVEAASGVPLTPPRWGELATMTISYGHGVSTSPLHLAAAYATIVNGGTEIIPTLERREEPQNGARILSEETSATMNAMLRAVVTDGTASFGEVEGYMVGGKTGTADLPRPEGGYYEDRNLNTFASAFPMHDPQYVLIVTLREAAELSGPEPRRTAGWTAVPVAAEIIRRTAPLLGLRPDVEHPLGLQLSNSSN